MKITLLGMSGIGKTYWANQLEQTGFQRFSVDDLIESKLGTELSVLGYEGIRDVAKWMGQPYEKQYPETSQIYLDFEQESVLELLSQLNTKSYNRSNVVIDTTGSVIYLTDTVLRALSESTVMIYFHTPESAHKEMARQYLLDPKPVIWGDSYNQIQGETTIQAIARCYPKLLQDRTTKYKQLAKITLDYTQLRSSTMTVQDIIKQINRTSHA